MGVALVLGCSSSGNSRLLGKQTKSGEGLSAGKAASSGADAAPETCPDPSLGTPDAVPIPLVIRTAEYESFCEMTAQCGAGFTDPSQVALDYGDFPPAFKSNGQFSGVVLGTFFFAVIARGFEDGGFLDGAPGNLSDTTPSSVPGDRGGGDTAGDRTIVADGTTFRFPQSWGTHHGSFPPSQFVAVSLAPFDVTPSGQYELALCRSPATSRCDCGFDTFSIVPQGTDAGAGAGGSNGAGGAANGGANNGAGGAVDGGASNGGTSNGGAANGGAGGAMNGGGIGGAPCTDAGAGGASAGGAVNGGASGAAVAGDAGPVCDAGVSN